MRYKLSTLLIVVFLIALVCPLLVRHFELSAFRHELHEINLELIQTIDERTHLVRHSLLGREHTLHVYPDTEHFRYAVRLFASQSHPNIPVAVDAGSIAGGQGYLLTSVVPDQQLSEFEFEDELVQSVCTDVGQHVDQLGFVIPELTYQHVRKSSDGRFLIAPEAWLQNDIAR